MQMRHYMLIPIHTDTCFDYINEPRCEYFKVSTRFIVHFTYLLDPAMFVHDRMYLCWTKFSIVSRSAIYVALYSMLQQVK